MSIKSFDGLTTITTVTGIICDRGGIDAAGGRIHSRRGSSTMIARISSGIQSRISVGGCDVGGIDLILIVYDEILNQLLKELH